MTATKLTLINSKIVLKWSKLFVTTDKICQAVLFFREFRKYKQKHTLEILVIHWGAILSS